MKDNDHLMVRNTRRALVCIWCILLLFLATIISYYKFSLYPESGSDEPVLASVKTTPVTPVKQKWSAPDTSLISNDEQGELIRYGRRLVSHTARFLGPKGIVSQTTNGMNCQNCHLSAGTKFLGNNYSAVASTYPKFRARSGTVETVEKRVNDCIERSLNGKKLDDNSREMKAFVAYITWVGKDVPAKTVPDGAGLAELNFLDRPADPRKGKMVYAQQCVRCHGLKGEGVRHPDGLEWLYPPLWGKNSYNTGAGLYRLSRMAGYIKVNMPFDLASIEKPVLTDEEAWDVAAYVNSLPRPEKDLSHDWPDISKKPVDHPFGPYADSFSEAHHKYGPFGPITSAKK